MTSLPLKIKKTYENIQTNYNDQRLMVLMEELRNRTRWGQTVVVNKEIFHCFIFSEIVESESLKNVTQQKLADMLEWISEIDVEAVQLNGLLFVNAVSTDQPHCLTQSHTVGIVQVANCVTSQDDTAVGPLVDIILDKIHGEEFWNILDDLVLNVINRR